MARSKAAAKPAARKASKPSAQSKAIAKPATKTAAKPAPKSAAKASPGKSTRFRVMDTDSHVLEGPALWTKFLEPEYRALARSWFWPYGDDIDEKVFLNGSSVPGLNRSGIPRHAIWKPGMTAEQIGGLDPKVRHPANPGASNARARLADMDTMGVHRAVLYPTLFLHYFPLVENPDVAAALARAYNNWVRDFAKAAPDRLIPVAVLPAQNIGLAVKELKRVAKLGFRAAMMTPAFHKDLYPSQRLFDPLWQTFEASGLVACVHPMAGPAAMEGDINAPFIDRMAEYANVGQPVSEAIAPTMDMSVFLTSMMAEGLLENFPRLKLALAHSGASWLPVILEKAETYLWLSPQEHPVSLEPEKVFFNRQTMVNFTTGEGGVRRMPEDFAGVAGWGSLYPNHDASSPAEAISDLEQGGVPRDIIERLMGGNAAKLFGFAKAA